MFIFRNSIQVMRSFRFKFNVASTQQDVSHTTERKHGKSEAKLAPIQTLRVDQTKRLCCQMSLLSKDFNTPSSLLLTSPCSGILKIKQKLLFSTS